MRRARTGAGWMLPVVTGHQELDGHGHEIRFRPRLAAAAGTTAPVIATLGRWLLSGGQQYTKQYT